MLLRWSAVAFGLSLILITRTDASLQCDAGSSKPRGNARAQIHRDVMCQYDHRVPPRTVTNVTLAMFIRTARVVESTLEMHTLVDLWWEDPSLVWDHTTSSIEEIEVKSDEIWTPDITTIVTLTWERGGGPQEGLWPATCHVRWNGSVHCSSAMEVGGDCGVSALHWPFLDATCSVYMGLDFRTDSGVNVLFAETDDRRGYVPGNDWIVTNVTREHIFDASAVTYGIKLRSRGSVQATALLGPGVVLSTLITSSFCLPIASTIRLGISCCATLGTVLTYSFIFQALPPLEGPTPIAITSYCALLVLSGISTLITLALAALLPDHHKPLTPPQWLYSIQDWLLNTKAGNTVLSLLLLTTNNKNTSQSIEMMPALRMQAGETIKVDREECVQADSIDAEPDSSDGIRRVTIPGTGPHKIWEFFASLLNRCLFFMYLITCLAICMHIAYMIATYEAEIDPMIL